MSKTIFLPSFLSILFLLSSAFAPAGNPERYCNNRYNFCVTYPGEVFVDKKSSPNNDGIFLLSTDRDVEMRVTGYYNVMGWTLQDEYQEILEIIRSESTDNIKEARVDYTGNEVSAVIQMGIVTTFARIVQIGDHFVSLIIVTNRQGANNPANSIDALLGKIDLEVGEIE